MTATLKSKAFADSSLPAAPGDNPVDESFVLGFKAKWSEQVVEMKTFETLRRLVSRAVAITIRRDSR